MLMLKSSFFAKPVKGAILPKNERLRVAKGLNPGAIDAIIVG
jgi:hypothetical protein